MAYVVLACMNIFIGIVSTVSTFMLELFADQEELNEINIQLKKVGNGIAECEFVARSV